VKPLAIDLFCGLGGWAEGFLAEGYYVVGFDIERHDYGTGGYPGQLVLQDVRTIHGSQFKNAACIVASPPCQKYSYMAMPWKRAKAQIARYREDESRIAELNELFDACFRIQREASEAAGHHIPMVVENVKGAQSWVGRAGANFGSFYLWGDVAMVGQRVVVMNGKLGSDVGVRAISASKVPGFRFDGSGKSFQSESVKVAGMNWSKHGTPGYKVQGFNVTAAQIFRASEDGVKGFTPHGQPLGKNELGRKFGSKSDSRKAASAMIAKIPFPLALHIARTFKPLESAA